MRNVNEEMKKCAAGANFSLFTIHFYLKSCIFAVMEWKIIHIDETDSTNRWLKEGLAADDSGLTQTMVDVGVRKSLLSSAAINIALVADYQTAGRGCGTNTWESERGKNLLFSILIHPVDLPANRQFLVSMTMANSIAKVVSKYVKNVSIKWPNDIYVGDSKLCGMLIENRLKGSTIKDSIIGVGLNVNQLRFVSDAPNPISLANLTGREFDRDQLLQELLQAFDEEWEDINGVRSRYLEQLYRRTGSYRYRDSLGEFLAELVTVEEDGHLVLRNTDEYSHKYAFKEVQFII